MMKIEELFLLALNIEYKQVLSILYPESGLIIIEQL